MNKKKILVTGGAGFVGSHLCERLSQNPNYEVYSLDNYFTGSVDNHVPNVTYIKGNTSDIAKLNNFCP
jgi:UDP-glucose 4-epimerase